MLETSIEQEAPVTDTHKTFSIRIPVALYDSVDTAAADEHRSRNGIIVSAINLYLERRRVATEGAAKFVAEFDRNQAHEMTVDRTLQAAAATQAPPPAPVTDFPGLTVRNPPKAVDGKS
jgi:predicted transcriptional regulator